MPLQIFGFHEHPSDFAVTKLDVSLEECAFLLDFARPLVRIRWLGIINRWLGLTIALEVPIVHLGEKSGGYVIGVRRSDPYYPDIPKLWKKHAGSKRTISLPSVAGLEIVADFGMHFAEDCS